MVHIWYNGKPYEVLDETKTHYRVKGSVLIQKAECRLMSTEDKLWWNPQ